MFRMFIRDWYRRIDASDCTLFSRSPSTAPGTSAARYGWSPIGQPASDAACHIGSYTGSWKCRHSTTGFGRMNVPTRFGTFDARLISAAAASTSCCGMIAMPNRRSGAWLQKSASQSL